MIVFRIKEVRTNKNITAYKLAKATKISRSYLSELENNKRMNVSLQVLLNIANFLDVNVKELFYTALDIDALKQEMYRRIDEFGITSKEALEVSELIDLLVNLKMKEV